MDCFYPFSFFTCSLLGRFVKTSAYSPSLFILKISMLFPLMFDWIFSLPASLKIEFDFQIGYENNSESNHLRSKFQLLLPSNWFFTDLIPYLLLSLTHRNEIWSCSAAFSIIRCIGWRVERTFMLDDLDKDCEQNKGHWLKGWENFHVAWLGEGLWTEQREQSAEHGI